ncbi:MAG: hypothetical protein QOJ55_2619 [Solirubrobacteraceae bacterium]|nr:hypothetical protein [Solirubrobacteraceae bacterium]
MPVAHAPALHAQAHRRAARVDRNIARIIDQARAFCGLPRLRFSRPLARVARGHSSDLLAHDTLSHNSTTGAPFSWRIHRVTRARAVGETIALFRGRPSGATVVRAWLSSPSHRAELLSPAYARVGVGRVRRHGLVLVTADFASGR